MRTQGSERTTGWEFPGWDLKFGTTRDAKAKSGFKVQSSSNEYVAVPFGRWEERRFYGLVLAWQWHTITLSLINTLRGPCLIHENIHTCVHMAPI